MKEEKMVFWKKWLLKWKKTGKTEQTEPDEEQAEDVVLHRDDVDLNDQSQRRRYIKSCLEQMRDGEEEIRALTREYSRVTSHLTDMEEIEALPDPDQEAIRAAAEKIAVYEQQQSVYLERKSRMSDSEFQKVERMESEVEEGIDKLNSAEEYQEKIRQDLNRLAGEKHAYQYRRHELERSVVNMRGMMIICSFAFVTCMILLLLLRVLLEMDVQIGCLLAVAATVIAVFLIYLKYTESVKELHRVEKTVNRLILLRNRVKIRYVNNTNLLDYLYVKYQVGSAGELVTLWNNYQEEKEERLKFKELHEELDYCQKDLLKLLRQYHVQDPDIWLRQTEALLSHGEMVEIRHGLIVRRQKLRKQMEYNEQLAESAQMEIRALVEEFPIYREEILEMVEVYEKNTKL